MRIYCAVCKTETDHKVLKEKVRKVSDDEVQVVFQDIYQIIGCQGCKSISFRHCASNSDDYNPETNKPFKTIKLYPIRGRNILPIKWYSTAPLMVKSIFHETIEAFNNNLILLCAGGLRAIIESICNAEGIKNGLVEVKKGGTTKIVRRNNLEGKINGLHERGILTKKHAAILHEHRFLGNESLHSINKPSKNALKAAIEIIETTLDGLYEISNKAGTLILHRKKRQKGITS